MDAGAQARQAADRASAATREAVATLLHAGLTVRDAGRLLELSPQRVSQLAVAPPRLDAPAKKRRAAASGAPGLAGP